MDSKVSYAWIPLGGAKGVTAESPSPGEVYDS